MASIANPSWAQNYNYDWLNQPLFGTAGRVSDWMSGTGQGLYDGDKWRNPLTSQWESVVNPYTEYHADGGANSTGAFGGDLKAGMLDDNPLLKWDAESGYAQARLPKGINQVGGYFESSPIDMDSRGQYTNKTDEIQGYLMNEYGQYVKYDPIYGAYMDDAPYQEMQRRHSELSKNAYPERDKASRAFTRQGIGQVLTIAAGGLMAGAGGLATEGALSGMDLAADAGGLFAGNGGFAGGAFDSLGNLVGGGGIGLGGGGGNMSFFDDILGGLSDDFEMFDWGGGSDILSGTGYEGLDYGAGWDLGEYLGLDGTSPIPGFENLTNQGGWMQALADKGVPFDVLQQLGSMTNLPPGSSSALKSVLSKILGGETNGQQGGSMLSQLLGLGAGIGTAAYGLNQFPKDTSLLEGPYSQISPAGATSAYDIATGTGRDALTSSLTNRGVFGSSFGDQSMTNYNTTRDLGRSSLLNQSALSQAQIGNMIYNQRYRTNTERNSILGQALNQLGLL